MASATAPAETRPIVARDSPVRRFEELRGKRYAFSDPLSNSGHLVPVYMLVRAGETPERFFKRYIFTYSHSANVEAVAVKFLSRGQHPERVHTHG